MPDGRAGECPALIDAYDGALFDLDGVVYLGPAPVPGAADGIAALQTRGARLGYVTNNAARPPEIVAAHLRELGIELDDASVVTSSQAAAHALAERFGAGAPILLVGGDGVRSALRAEGLVPVTSADDEPVAVVQGWSPDLTWAQLNEAAIAIQRGAYWLATNTDLTRPTDRGIVPGNGAAVAAVGEAVSVRPEVVGKPFRPLIDEALRRSGSEKMIFVGDRTDTDIAGAVAVGLDSLLVLSGAHGPADLLVAGPDARPTQVGFDLCALLAPARTAVVTGDTATCRQATVRWVDGELVPQGSGCGDDHYLDILWAGARLAWDFTDQGRHVDPASMVKALDGLR